MEPGSPCPTTHAPGQLHCSLHGPERRSVHCVLKRACKVVPSSVRAMQHSSLKPWNFLSIRGSAPSTKRPAAVDSGSACSFVGSRLPTWDRALSGVVAAVCAQEPQTLYAHSSLPHLLRGRGGCSPQPSDAELNQAAPDRSIEHRDSASSWNGRSLGNAPHVDLALPRWDSGTRHTPNAQAPEVQGALDMSAARPPGRWHSCTLLGRHAGEGFPTTELDPRSRPDSQVLRFPWLRFLLVHARTRKKEREVRGREKWGMDAAGGPHAAAQQRLFEMMVLMRREVKSDIRVYLGATRSTACVPSSGCSNALPANPLRGSAALFGRLRLGEDNAQLAVRLQLMISAALPGPDILRNQCTQRRDRASNSQALQL
ncbi:hypothetical protein L1887_50637 [Cichorium endivia]|nr:hypothetical protein L1887_50637 [Cichorium endivia]